MSKIFITGASSYLGSSLIKTFKEHSFIGLENKNILPNLPNLKSVKINKFSDFYEILNINNVDTIFHFATNSIRGNDELNKKEIYKVNVELGEVLLNAAIDLNIKKFITAGTYSQNIFKKIPNYYIESKQLFQELLTSNSGRGTDITNLHLGDVYGPNDFRNKLIPYLLKNENENSINLSSNGLGPFSPIHILDVIGEIKKDITTIHAGDKYIQTILATEIRTVKTFIEQFKEIRSKKFTAIYDENQINPYEIYSNVFNTNPVSNIDIRDGLKSI